MKVLFAVTEDWYFWSHREPLAAQLRADGCDIVVATRFNKLREAFEGRGLYCVPMTFERSLRHPLRDIRAAIALWRNVVRLSPDVVHLVSLKPIVLSFLSILATRKTRFVAAFTGMGYLFSSSDNRARLVQRVIVVMLRLLLSRSNVWVIVQNEDDRELLRQHDLGSPERTRLIAGVGVDLQKFSPTPLSHDRTIVVLPARLIWDKGIAEFVAAAAIVRAKHMQAEFVLVGDLDPDNPAAIPETQIQLWLKRGDIQWWGHQEDMAAVYQTASIVCLPSYREGLPKVLLEAAACGRPLIATDVPGCRDVCRDGVNGLLVAPRDEHALAHAIIALIDEPARAAGYGAAARETVETHYALEKISRSTLEFYRRMLAA